MAMLCSVGCGIGEAAFVIRRVGKQRAQAGDLAPTEFFRAHPAASSFRSPVGDAFPARQCRGSDELGREVMPSANALTITRRHTVPDGALVRLRKAVTMRRRCATIVLVSVQRVL